MLIRMIFNKMFLGLTAYIRHSSPPSSQQPSSGNVPIRCEVSYAEALGSLTFGSLVAS